MTDKKPPSLKLLVKPEGYDLRDRRSLKSQKSEEWQPTDALYSAQERILKQNVETCLVLWRETLPDGNHVTHHALAGNPDQVEAVLLNGMGKLLDWRNRPK